MVEDAYVNHVPVMTGGFGKAALRDFYSREFIPSMPPDTTLTPISRTVGEDQLVDEMIFSFTHTQEMPWMLPGVAPTNARVEVALVAIVRFRDGKLAHEHIYWDQASVLKQIGLLSDPALPVCGRRRRRRWRPGRRRPRNPVECKQPAVPECRNWQTNRTQNPAHFTGRVGSSPTSGTISYRFCASGLRRMNWDRPHRLAAPE